MIVGLRHVGQVFNIHGHHAAGLLEELPRILAGHLLLFCHAVPPVVIVHRVGIHPDPVPCGPAVPLGRVSANPVGQPVNHSLGKLPGLVHPGTGELKGQQFAHILGLVKGQEDDLAVNAGRITPGRQPDVVGNGRCPQHLAESGLWKQIQPGLNGGGLQHGIAVSHNGPARIPDVVNGRGLLLHGLNEDLGRAAVALAGAHWAHDALDKVLGLDEVVDHRGLAEVQVKPADRD